MRVAEKTASRRSTTLEDCDREVSEWWRKFCQDPKADGDECMQKIDQWLDTRLLIMSKGEAIPIVEEER